MNTEQTEIRRLAYGSIDTDHYIRHCHRERSLAAHRAIRRAFDAPGALIRKLAERRSEHRPARGAPLPAE